MTTLAQKTDETTVNDIYTVGTDFAFASGKDCYSTILEDAIRTLLGEIQLDLAVGIDYQNTVWVKQTRLNRWKKSVIKCVRSFPFVETISGFEASVVDNTKVSFVLTVKTTDSETVSVSATV